MKQLMFIPIIIIIAAIAQSFMPWWSLAIVCFVVCYYTGKNGFLSFAGSFVAIFLLWSVKAWMTSQFSDVPMYEILGGIIGNISGSTSIFLTGLVGGLVGGMSGLTGSLFKSMMKK